MKISDLFVAGAVVATRTSIWRARARILAEDLGIPQTSEVQAALSLGQIRLAESSAFEAVNAAVRAAEREIAFRSLPFSMIPGARYVPEDRLQDLALILEEKKREFYAAVDAFVADYATVKEKQHGIIRQALRDALEDEAEAERVFQRIQFEYPSEAALRSKFSFRWFVYTLKSVNKGAIAALSGEATEVRSIVKDMVEGLRAEVQEKLTQVLAIVAKGGKLQARSIESAMAVVDRVEQMNVLGDSGLQEQVVRLRTMLRSVTPETNGEVVLAGLQDVETALTQDIEQAVAEAELALTGMGRRKLAVNE